MATADRRNWIAYPEDETLDENQVITEYRRDQYKQINQLLNIQYNVFQGFVKTHDQLVQVDHNKVNKKRKHNFSASCKTN